MCTHAHTFIYTHTHIHIHRHIYTYTSPIYIHTQTYMHIYTYTYISTNANNPSPNPNMQLLAGYLQLKLIFQSYQNAKSNSNIQRTNHLKITLSSTLTKFGIAPVKGFGLVREMKECTTEFSK